MAAVEAELRRIARERFVAKKVTLHGYTPAQAVEFCSGGGNGGNGGGNGNLVAASYESEGVKVWNYERGEKVKRFSNGNAARSRITSVGWINERSDALLYAASDDGRLRVWANACDAQSVERLATGFTALLSARLLVAATARRAGGRKVRRFVLVHEG